MTVALKPLNADKFVGAGIATCAAIQFWISLPQVLNVSRCAAQTIVQGIEATEIVPGRCEVIDEDQPFGCVVDAADTPAALSRLMDGLRECCNKRLILVLGCPGEQEQGKRPFMGEIAHYKVCLLAYIPTQPNTP